MMNDRFSAQLRQHLLETASDRPAAGQLAAIVDHVAVTPQRHPLVARLAWMPGRIGTVPSATLRYGLIALALIGALLGVALLGGGSPTPAPSNPAVFEGTWYATDFGDGSGLTLVVGAGTAPSVLFIDDRATGAACVNDEVKVFTAEGTGQVSGSRLVATFPDGGGCGLVSVGVALAYDHDPVSNRLVDQDGELWSRTKTAPTAYPAMNPGCLDLNGGGTYEAAVGPLILGATLPSDTSWEALRDRFFLSRIGCPEPGMVWIDARVVSQVYPDACHRTDPALEVDSAAAAIAALADQASIGGPDSTVASIDGHPGGRIEMSVASGTVTSACADGTIEPLDGVSVEPGQTVTIDVVDVEGTVLAVVTNWGPEYGDLADQFNAIYGSLQVNP